MGHKYSRHKHFHKYASKHHARRHSPWHGRRKRWGLRRRLTFMFAFVALAAVGLTTWFTLGAVFSAQRELFGPSMMNMGDRANGRFTWDDPQFAAARAAFGRVTRTSFWAGLLAFFLASGVAAFVTRFLTRPLLALTDGARRLAAGERGLRLAVPSSQDEIRTLTEAFNNLVAGLERQERFRRNLVADVAHDLRTPLAVMRSEIEGMQDGVVKLDDAGLNRLHGEVMMLARLVEDLRTLSLAESGGMALQLENILLAPFLSQLVAAFGTRADAVGVTLTLQEVPDDLSIRGDPGALTRLLGNLLDNALRYASPGAVEVGVVQDAGGVTQPGVALWVRDHGPGLPGVDGEEVFERFYRGDVARTRRDSSGLGLAIAKALAEAHGGSLEAANHPDGGAVLTLHLPSQR